MPASVMAPRTSLKACSSVLPQCCPVEYKTKSSTYLRKTICRMLASPSTFDKKQSSKSTARAQPAGRPDRAW
eukprot:3742407-Amphidinium_carterae.1